MSQTSDTLPNRLHAWLSADRSFSAADIRVGLTRLFLAIGLLVRVMEYADNRQIYLDERLLLENLTDLPVWDFHTVLKNDQLAPPGFLVLERMMVRLPLPKVPAARFIPFLAAIAAMWWFPKVAARYVDRRAVPLATALFAFGDYTVYYAAEIKQYSLEVALALMALGLAARAGEEGIDESERRKRLGLLGIFGVVGVWFSLPLIFSLAGVGLVGFVRPLLRKDWKRAGAWVAIGVGWLASFGGCFLVCDRIVTKEPFLRTWWDFAFLRIPPKSMAEATEVFWQLVNVVIDPTGLVTPLSHVSSGLLWAALFLGGLVAMMRRAPAKWVVLVAPFVFAVIAAALKQYPFHGRLIQFLIPTVVFLAAEGVAALSYWGWAGFAASLVLAAFLLVQPAYDSLYYRVMQARSRTFDSHGDLHNDLLDEREQAARKAEMDRKFPR